MAEDLSPKTDPTTPAPVTTTPLQEQPDKVVVKPKGSLLSILLMILGFVVIASAIYLWWQSREVAESDSTDTVSSSSSSASLTSTSASTSSSASSLNSSSVVAATAGWSTYEISDLDLSFKYPAGWGTVSIRADANADAGTSKSISFSNLINNDSSSVVFGYASTDFEAGREGTEYEMYAISSKSGPRFNSCTSYNDLLDTSKTCELVNEKSIIVTTNPAIDFEGNPNPEMKTYVGYYFTGNTLYPGLAIEANVAASDTTMFEIVKLLLNSITVTD